MRKLILILFVFSAAYAQKHELPDVSFNFLSKKKSDYYQELGIKDKKAIIVSAGKIGAFQQGDRFFLVYSTNRPVRKFIVDNKTESVQEISVNSEQSEYYWQFLHSIYTDDVKQINQQLYSTKSSIIVLDGPTDYFTIYQNKQSLHLNSNGSESQIKAKTEGWEERQKLLDLIKKFEDAFNKE